MNSGPSNIPNADNGSSNSRKAGISKAAVAIIALFTSALTAAITWLATYYSDHTTNYTQMLSSAKAELSLKNSEWTSSALIRKIPLEDEERKEIVDKLMATRVTISSFYTNDEKVDALVASYRDALEEAMGAVNRFDGTRGKLNDMINSLQHASNIGGELGVEIGDLSASFSRKLQATLSSKGDTSSG